MSAFTKFKKNVIAFNERATYISNAVGLYLKKIINRICNLMIDAQTYAYNYKTSKIVNVKPVSLSLGERFENE